MTQEKIVSSAEFRDIRRRLLATELTSAELKRYNRFGKPARNVSILFKNAALNVSSPEIKKSIYLDDQGGKYFGEAANRVLSESGIANAFTRAVLGKDLVAKIKAVHDKAFAEAQDQAPEKTAKNIRALSA